MNINKIKNENGVINLNITPVSYTHLNPFEHAADCDYIYFLRS